MYRVNQLTFYRRATYDLNRMQSQQYDLNAEWSSGKRINKPSDDSLRTISAQYSTRRLEEVEQYDQNLSYAQSWLQQYESSMGQMSNLLTRMKELAEQMSTGTYTGENRAAAATEVHNMMSEIITLMNTEIGGSHIFAGTQVNTSAASQKLMVQNPAEVNWRGAGSTESSAGLYGMGEYTGLLSRDIKVQVVGVWDDATSSWVAGDGDDIDSTHPLRVEVSYVDDDTRTVTKTVDLLGAGSAYAQDVGDGIKVYVDEGYHNPGDHYTLDVGRQQGNEEGIEINLSWSNRMTYNYTMEQILGAEGNEGGEWGNLLDVLADWADILTNDSTTQDYFVTQNAVQNDPSSQGEFLVTGDWNELAKRKIEFTVGGPIQYHLTAGDPGTELTDADIQSRQFEFYLEDNTYSGVPASGNPMVLHVRYFDGAWQDGGTVTITSTGPDGYATYTDPVSGEDIEMFVANAHYDINNLTFWDGGAAAPGTGTSFLTYGSDTDPDDTSVDVTYTFTDDNGVRQYATRTLDGTGEDNALDLSEMQWFNEAVGSEEMASATALGLNGSFEIWVFNANQAGQSFTINVAATDTLQDVVDTINATVPATLSASITGNHFTLDADDGVNFALADDTAGFLETVGISFGGETSLYLSEGATVDDGDYWVDNRDRYNQGQSASQEILTTIDNIEANLLKNIADAGARLNRIEVREILLEDDTLRIYDRLEQTEDADVAKVAVQLSTVEILYQATLKAISAVSSRSLADYL